MMLKEAFQTGGSQRWPSPALPAWDSQPQVHRDRLYLHQVQLHPGGLSEGVTPPLPERCSGMCGASQEGSASHRHILPHYSALSHFMRMFQHTVPVRRGQFTPGGFKRWCREVLWLRCCGKVGDEERPSPGSVVNPHQPWTSLQKGQHGLSSGTDTRPGAFAGDFSPGRARLRGRPRLRPGDTHHEEPPRLGHSLGSGALPTAVALMAQSGWSRDRRGCVAPARSGPLSHRHSGTRSVPACSRGSAAFHVTAPFCFFFNLIFPLPLEPSPPAGVVAAGGSGDGLERGSGVIARACLCLM